MPVILPTVATVGSRGAQPRRGKAVAGLCSSTRQPQGSLHRLDNGRADCGVRIFGTQTIVKNLPHQSRVSKYTSGHGHRDVWLLRKKAPNHDFRNAGQFGSGLCQHRAGQLISLIGSRKNMGQEAGEIRWRRGVSYADQVIQTLHCPRPGDDLKQNGTSAFVLSVYSRGNGRAADPVAGALVTNCKSPTARACRLAPRILAVCDGTSAGNNHHARTAVKGSLQGNHRIADNLNFSGNKFGDHVPHFLGDLRPRATRSPYAGALDLSRLNSCGASSLPNRLVQRAASLGFPDANNVAGAGGGAGQP